jgi:CRP-like cAMP-binding protein
MSMAEKPHDIRLFHGEALFRAGQPARHFFLVNSGAICILDEAGTSAIKQFLPGELFGIPEVMANGEWKNTALAQGATTLTSFAASNLFRSLDEMPREQREFIEHIAQLACPA